MQLLTSRAPAPSSEPQDHIPGLLAKLSPCAHCGVVEHPDAVHTKPTHCAMHMHAITRSTETSRGSQNMIRKRLKAQVEGVFLS